MKIHKQFISVGDRRVLLRYAAPAAATLEKAAPAIVLLHQSPQNSRSMVPWIERLASQYAVFAPDTPGFGESDPLPLAQAEIPDYAAALAQLFDVLKIERAMVFGVHTGAVTALRFAIDFPERVAALVCDGYPSFNADERSALLTHYLPPFEPAWDGGHLMWLFARMREQHFYFPWHDHRASARLNYPIPAPGRIHSDVMDVLDVGDRYRSGYRAAFLYDDANAVTRLKVPAHLFYREEDVLGPHIDRLPIPPEHVHIVRIVGGPAALIVKADEVFATYQESASKVDSLAAVNKVLSPTRAVLETQWGDLAYRLVHGRGSETIIYLNDIGVPATIPVTHDMAMETLLPDLPGQGASRDGLDSNCTPETIALAMLALVDEHKFERIVVIGVGGSAACAVMLCRLLEARCMRLELHNPLPLSAAERGRFLAQLPDLSPLATGGHLQAAWNHVRHRHLFWPWLLDQNPPDGNAARQLAAPAPLDIHHQVVEVLRAGACYRTLWTKSLEVNLVAELLQLETPMRLMSHDEKEPLRQATLLATVLNLEQVKNGAASHVWKSRQPECLPITI